MALITETHPVGVELAAELADPGGAEAELPGNIKGALAEAFKANRPVVIDVVTDIDALAPLAVTS